MLDNYSGFPIKFNMQMFMPLPLVFLCSSKFGAYRITVIKIAAAKFRYSLKCSVLLFHPSPIASLKRQYSVRHCASSHVYFIYRTFRQFDLLPSSCHYTEIFFISLFILN
jgi:hypothetical protein